MRWGLFFMTQINLKISQFEDLKMITHLRLNTLELQSLIRQRKIKVAGNLKLKIYGTLRCASGKRMKKENRVFFKNEREAIKEGFRPCGHCMQKSFLDWKAKQNNMVLRYGRTLGKG
jgi:hypothetical protein